MKDYILQNEGYDCISQKFDNFKIQTERNNLNYRTEVRGVVNESFFSDFQNYELKVLPTENCPDSTENKININNECLDELYLSKKKLEAQSDDIVYFQKLKTMLKNVDGILNY